MALTASLGVGSELSDDDLRSLYRLMLLVRTADRQAVMLQRQGRIGFYVPCEGEEAAEVGSAFALDAKDWIFTDYRGSGVVLARGMPLTTFFAQLMARASDRLNGRNMPSHWGSKDINVVAPSSNICTQLPHAVGVALAAKMKGDSIASIAYFGEGGTSSNDFHSALNFAGVFRVPTIFFCRNNQYAISTPVSRQTASHSISGKALAYGIDGVQVDGNDVLAVLSTTKKALRNAREDNQPTLIEAVTYRTGPHTTSDDPKKYRDEGELHSWETRDPIRRFAAYLKSQNLLTDEEEEYIRTALLQEVKQAIRNVEAEDPTEITSLFDDVYSDRPWNLEQQRLQLMDEMG
jgi:TPP-dependent pyruvate/acetoin dehydrogenase alpha subunit